MINRKLDMLDSPVPPLPRRATPRSLSLKLTGGDLFIERLFWKPREELAPEIRCEKGSLTQLVLVGCFCAMGHILLDRKNRDTMKRV